MVNHTGLTGQLLAGKKIFLVEKPISSDEQESLSDNLEAAILTIGVTRYDIVPDWVSKEYLLSIWGDDINSSEELSRYRLICQNLSRLSHGAVLIYDAHQLSGESIQLFAQLVRYVEQHELNWRFIFVANPAHENFVRLSLLSKDIHVAGTIDSTFQSTLGSASNLSAESLFESDKIKIDDSPSSFRNAMLLLGALVFTVLGYFYINGVKPDTAVNLDKMSEVELTTNKPEFTKLDHSKPAQTGVNDYLTMLAEKELEFEQELQRIKSANESQNEGFSVPVVVKTSTDRPLAKQQTSQPIIKQSSNKLRPANKLLPRNVIAMISTGDVEGLKTLSAQSGVFEGRDPNGQSALIASVIVQQQPIAELLLQQGVSTEFVDGFGQTALYHAAIQGDIPMVATLIDGGANVNALTDLNKTSLMASVHNGHLELTKYLLSKGARVNLQDHSGWSALFYATWNSRDDIVFTLKTAGASDALRDNDGYTLAEISRYRPTVD